MAKRRHHRRARKNPSTTTWMIVGGVVVAGVAAYYLWPKPAAAVQPKPAVLPPVGPTAPTSQPPAGSNCAGFSNAVVDERNKITFYTGACNSGDAQACFQVDSAKKNVASYQQMWNDQCGKLFIQPLVKV